MRPGAGIPLGPESVRVTFAVRWFGLVTVRGRFGRVGGSLRAVDPVGGIEIVLDAASDSIQTGIALRDRHLRGARFLDAERHPAIAFRGTGTWQGGELTVSGTLCLRGATRSIVVPCVHRSRPGAGGDVPVDSFEAEFAIARHDHGIGAATGLSRLNPLLWAISPTVQIRVKVFVPVALVRAEPILARVR
jgi:polyisoprenoid-binding protein YceI